MKKQIKYLSLLSKYGLIPKIYYIDKNTIIMEYIKGVSYYEYVYKYPNKEGEINNKIAKLEKIWYDLGFSHGDLVEKNILISHNSKVYFIDPGIMDMYTDEELREIENKL